jgi:polysaccharide export outer membrane protein
LPLLLLAACTPGANLPPLPAEPARGAYRLGPEDRLRVTTFTDPRLTGEFRVSDSRSVALPLDGAMRAAGLTTTAFEGAVERLMRERGLFTAPSVAAEVIAWRPIFVRGIVERGGQFPYQPGMTVLSAVAVAGGFNYRAVQDYVSITRVAEEGRAQEIRADRQALIQPGDVVTVFERRL